MAEQVDRVSPHPRTKGGSKVKRAARRTEILRQVVAGKSNEQIAEAMNLRPAAVAKIVNETLEKWQAEDAGQVEAVRSIQLRRLDAAIQAIMGDVEAGVLAAIDRLTKLETLRARIAGTEAPQKIEHSGTVQHQISREEVDSLQRAWEAAGAIDGEVVEEIEPAALPA